MALKPPYKGERNIWLTASLFWEQWILLPEDKRSSAPVFTVSVDKPGLINFRKTFVELEDPTGYKWAIQYLGDYDHWLKLTRSQWFQAAYEHAMNELKMKLRSEALVSIKKIAVEGSDAQALVASKYLAGYEWEKSSRGRPSKQEVTGELKKQAALLTEEDSDAERIGLNLKVVK